MSSLNPAHFYCTQFYNSQDTWYFYFIYLYIVIIAQLMNNMFKQINEKHPGKANLQPPCFE